MDWPSLSCQITLAQRLFGPRGKALIADWLEIQMARITDPEFARLFSDHMTVPGAGAGDFNHRLVSCAAGHLLGGIRFYGGDISRPFVEIVAHDFQDWQALTDCAAREWAVFHPAWLRIIVPHASRPVDHVQLDMTIYAARYGDMRPADGRVSLRPFSSPDEAAALVKARYHEMAENDPALARNVTPAHPGDLAQWHARGHLQAIWADTGNGAGCVGLFAVMPGRVEWIEGDEVMEEVIATPFRGNRFAASAQREWAARPDLSPRRLLVGTIDGLNIASRCAASHAGRRPVLDYIFLPCTQSR